MKTILLPLWSAILIPFAPGHAATLLHDTWADGSRAEQGLPAQSAWYASSASSLSASAGSLVGTATSSSRMWLTYFADPGSVASLGVGETLKVSLDFTLQNVTAAPATSRGMRIGLYNWSESALARQAADSFSTSGLGDQATGYMLNMNVAQSFTTDNPIQVLERTDVANANLMGSTSQYTTLGSGGGKTGDPGFADGTPYTLELSVMRTAADSVDITADFSSGTWHATYTASDLAGAATAFDTLAIRVNKSTDAAETFSFSRCKVEVVPEPGVLLLLGAGLAALKVSRNRRVR
ncbi:MAG TPA: PEP-CTERM sorting domain-containing protein [Verrucomicrobiota bacterium]|nr:PEP-CTERM sorting domain-containing protein [Verrucomicrobiota bacterium]HNU52155.1 PEP-CTERM sorting domain-containing protein [Verrucomicrobiota bacterium]